MKNHFSCPRTREGSKTTVHTVRTVRSALSQLARSLMNDGANIHSSDLPVSANGRFVRKRPINHLFL